MRQRIARSCCPPACDACLGSNSDWLDRFGKGALVDLGVIFSVWRATALVQPTLGVGLFWASWVSLTSLGLGFVWLI